MIMFLGAAFTQVYGEDRARRPRESSSAADQARAAQRVSHA
jgi:hypothetical protein